jgi:trans-2,3-dihydro-3-hydroxyanthranilate isomerase
MAPASAPLEGLDPFAGTTGAGALRYVLLDVFTDTPLEGNPLAVFTGDADGMDAALMQRLARELNLSESVFLQQSAAGGDARARIFTPSAELPFAGHPVLGTAALLSAAQGRAHVTLETGAGEVSVSFDKVDGRARFGTMAQPLPTWQPFPRQAELLTALGVERSGLPVEEYVNGPHHVYVELPDEPSLAALAPDMGAVAALGEMGVGCFAGDGATVQSRNFAPGLGVPEDPATGSAAGPLAVHLARHGRVAYGERVEIRQGLQIGRPSKLFACAHGSSERLERVEVGGWATVVGAGELRL